MKKAIVSGASGFIGNSLIKELLRNGYFVYALSREESFEKVLKHENVQNIPFHLEEVALVKNFLSKSDYDSFYHFAWVGSAGKYRSDVALQLNNARWTIDTLRLAKDVGCKRFICAGSITEHETIAATYTKGNKPGLGFIYGGGKVASHIMSMSIAADIGIDLLWPVITNAYGVGEYSPRLINTTIRKCIKGESPQFTSGTQNYDFVYIDDVARAFRLIAENGKPFYEYLIGSSKPRALKDFMIDMQEAIAPELEFRFGDIPFTGVNLPLSNFDCSLTEKDTGFRAQISFAEGCKKTYEWWKKQEANKI